LIVGTVSTGGSNEEAVEKILPSVVNISTVQLLMDFMFLPTPVTGVGSGTVVGEDGLIATNFHVVRGTTDINVTLADGTVVIGRVVGMDQESDVALVKVDASGLRAAELGDSDTLRIGQPVLAIGNPLGLMGGPTVTAGVISAFRRNIRGQGVFFEELLQTDAAINPGNSGGPLIDLSGKVVGINTAVIPYAQGIGFAIPINVVKRVVDDLLTYGRALKPFLGIVGYDLNEMIARYYELPANRGVFITEVVRGSPAHSAGIRRGDIVIAIDDSPVRNFSELRNAVRRRRIGEIVKVEIVRGGEILQLHVMLVERPKQ